MLRPAIKVCRFADWSWGFIDCVHRWSCRRLTSRKQHSGLFVLCAVKVTEVTVEETACFDDRVDPRHTGLGSEWNKCLLRQSTGQANSKIKMDCEVHLYTNEVLWERTIEVYSVTLELRKYVLRALTALSIGHNWSSPRTSEIQRSVRKNTKVTFVHVYYLKPGVMETISNG